MENNRSVQTQDVISSIINTGEIKDSTVIQISAGARSSFGLDLYTLDYFKDHKSTEKDFQTWKNGFSFTIEAIKEKKEFRREKVIEEIKTKLETNHKLLIVGESGTSKSTILMEIACDYLDNGYWVLFNDSTELTNSDVLVKFIEALLKSGKKILVAVDNAHSISKAAIFYIIDRLENYVHSKNVRFILTARLPDYNHFCFELGKVKETYRQSLQKLNDRQLNPNFKFEIPTFTKDDIKGFIEIYGDPEKLRRSILDKNQTYKQKGLYQNELSPKELDVISENIFQDTKGNAIMVKFSVLGQGLEKDVRNRYYNYLKGEPEKMKAMLACSFLELVDYPVTDSLMERMGLKRVVKRYLDRATLYCNSGVWSTIHYRWNKMFLFAFLFDSNRDNILYDDNIYHLKEAFNAIVSSKEMAAIISVVNGLFGRAFKYFSERIVDLYDSIFKSATNYLNDQKMVKLCISIYKGCVVAGFWNEWRSGECIRIDLRPKALEYLDKAINYNPNDYRIFKHKAEFFSFSKKINEALNCYEKAIDLAPTKYNLWKSKAVIHKGLNEFDKAIICFNKARELAPESEHKGLYRYIAEILFELDDFVQALDYYDKVIEMAPKETIWEELISNVHVDYYARAVCKVKLGDIEGTLDDLQKAIVIDKEVVNWAKEDPEFSSIRNDERFKVLLSNYK
jgi:tetratricopeptide (TPR) repeat protein